VGFIQAFSACIACTRPFFYNPMRVPSFTRDGVREPICPDCIDRINTLRRANGLPPIVPLAGAYEAADESELPDDDYDEP